VAGSHGPQAVSEVLSAFDHISIGKADHLAGLSEPQLEALFRARRLAWPATTSQPWPCSGR
jgi:hypothetical protein